MSLFQELAFLINDELYSDCPVLSGNMKNHIALTSKSDDEYNIEISGQSYDMGKWQKSGIITPTNEYDYAISVNALGAFGGRSTKSKHWVYRSVINTVNSVIGNYDAEIIVDLKGI